MSAIVKTLTPFIDRELLLNSLDDLSISYSERDMNIVTERVDYFGNQIFVWDGLSYTFQHDSDANMRMSQLTGENIHELSRVSDFLSALDEKYRINYSKKVIELEKLRLEEEKKRIEKAQKAYVEKQKKKIIEKAKSKGYKVTEKKKGNKTQLVLVKYTY